MALIVTFIGSNSERSSIVIPPEYTAEQVQEDLLRTPEGQWGAVPAIIDGARVVVYVRPDRYGMFFLHEVDNPSSLT